MPITIVGDDRAHSHADPETDDGGCDDRAGRRRGINDSGTIRRHVDDLRLGGLNFDDLVGHVDDLLLDRLLDDAVGNDDDLLRRRFEVACLLGFAPHGLDGGHHRFLVIGEGLAEIAGPIEVVVHFGDDIGKMAQRLNVLVPGLGVHFRDIIGVLDKPRSLDYLQGISRGRQKRGQERIRIKSDWRNQLFEIGFAPLNRC